LEALARKELFLRAKQAATYWFGLLSFERGKYESYESAIDYFDERTIRTGPKGPWHAGAYYNLGRSYEALKKPAEAIGCYESAFKYNRRFNPGYKRLYLGCLVRAKWLKAMYPEAAKPQVPPVDVPEPKITEPEVTEPEITEPSDSQVRGG